MVSIPFFNRMLAVRSYGWQSAAYLGNADSYAEVVFAYLLSNALSGLLHDIGKMMVPDNIIQKNGRLTLPEYSWYLSKIRLFRIFKAILK